MSFSNKVENIFIIFLCTFAACSSHVAHRAPSAEEHSAIPVEAPTSNENGQFATLNATKLSQFSTEVEHVCGYGKNKGPYGKEYARYYYDSFLPQESRLQMCEKWSSIKAEFLELVQRNDPTLKQSSANLFLPVEQFIQKSSVSDLGIEWHYHNLKSHLARTAAKNANGATVSNCKNIIEHIDRVCAEQFLVQEVCGSRFALGAMNDLIEEIRAKNTSQILDVRQAFPAPDMRSHQQHFGTGAPVVPQSASRKWIEKSVQDSYKKTLIDQYPRLRRAQLSSGSMGYRANYEFSNELNVQLDWTQSNPQAANLQIFENKKRIGSCQVAAQSIHTQAVDMSFSKRSLFPVWNQEACKELTDLTLIGKTMPELRQRYRSVIQSGCGPSSERTGQSLDCFQIQLNAQDYIKVKFTTFDGDLPRVTRVELFRTNYDLEALNQDIQPYGFKAMLIAPRLDAVTSQKRAQLSSLRTNPLCPVHISVGEQGRVIMTLGQTEGGAATGNSVAQVTIPDDRSDLKIFKEVPPKK